MKPCRSLSLAVLLAMLAAIAGPADAVQVRYIYDAAGRLTAAQYPCVTLAYTYDVDGNLVQRAAKVAWTLADSVTALRVLAQQQLMPAGCGFQDLDNDAAIGLAEIVYMLQRVADLR